MTKRPRQQPFAAIVREVEESPSPQVPERDGMTDPQGRRWTKQQQQISAARAFELAAEGASVAWDPCGCDGYCGFTWFSAEEVAQLLRAGRPTVRVTKRHRGNISEWATDDGERLVVAEAEVRWGDLLD